MNKVLKFIGVGFTAAIIDYLVYEFCLAILFNNNTSLITVAQLISLFFATIAAFFLHSHITWKGRDPGKYGIIKFFIWNLVILLLMRSFLSWFFGLMTWFYDFAFSISGSVGLSFSYEFVQSTLIFILMNIVTMTANFFFYDKFIFGQITKPVANKSAEHSADQKRKVKKS